jgi:Tol biopolymer transport system component
VKLKKIEATGGEPQTLADTAGWGGGTWSQDGVIVFGQPIYGLSKVPALGGVPVPVTAAEDRMLGGWGPFFLPDGRHFLYDRRARDESKSAIYLGSVDLKPKQQPSKPLVNSYWGPLYAPSADPNFGYLLFIAGDRLMAQPFDNRHLELTGQPVPLAEPIRDGRAFSVSANGVLVFRRNTQDIQPTLYSGDGKVLGTFGEPGFDGKQVAISPDGTHAALTAGSQGAQHSISLLDLSHGTSTRFAFGKGNDHFPVWSPDGRQIIFASDRDGPANLYRQSADGVNNGELLLSSSDDKYPRSWSRDGRYLLYSVSNPKGKYEIWVLTLEGDKKAFPFLATEFNEQDAHLSPDGRWVAYASDESGKFEIYVRPFSVNAAGTATELGGKWLISSGGGSNPRWRSDGRELYYQASDQKIMAVEITTSPAFRAKEPRPLGLVIPPESNWDSAPDGKRFLVTVFSTGKPEPYTVVLNWQAGLKQ